MRHRASLSVAMKGSCRSLGNRAVAVFATAALVGWFILPSGWAQESTSGKVARTQKGATNQEGIAKRIAQHGFPSTDVERQRSPLGANPRRIVHFVRPAETDSRIDRFLKDHYALIHRGVKTNGQLFLFLPGTYGRPSDYQLVLDTAAMAGYQVLGLEYVNSTDQPGGSINELCAREPDASCAGRVRQERIYGDDVSPLVDISRANAIVNRVEKALAYLDDQFPQERWGQFLKDGHIIWSKVAVGGHSQGAGMAAFIAKRHVVARVCLFSVWDDHNPATRGPAPWLLEKSATPAARYFAAFHERESFAKGSSAACKALGLASFGATLKMAADGSSPRSRSHIIALTLDPNPQTEGQASGDSFHSSTAVDFATPRDRNNRPAYRAAWFLVIGG